MRYNIPLSEFELSCRLYINPSLFSIDGGHGQAVVNGRRRIMATTRNWIGKRRRIMIGWANVDWQSSSVGQPSRIGLQEGIQETPGEASKVWPKAGHENCVLKLEILQKLWKSLNEKKIDSKIKARDKNNNECEVFSCLWARVIGLLSKQGLGNNGLWSAIFRLMEKLDWTNLKQ